MTRQETMEAVNAAIGAAKHLLLGNKRVFYRIRCASKYSTLDHTGGNNEENSLENFSKTLHECVNDPTTYTVFITFRDNHKELETNIPPIIVQQEIIPPTTKTEEKEEEKTQQQAKPFLDSNILNVLGSAMNLGNGLGDLNDKFGAAGVLLGLNKATMERDFERREKEREFREMQAKLQDLEKSVKELTEENKKLKDRNTKLENDLGDYEDIQEELEKLKSKAGMIAAVAGSALAGVAENLIAKTPFAGLMGLGQPTEVQAEEAGKINLEKPTVQEEVSVEPEEEEEETKTLTL